MTDHAELLERFSAMFAAAHTGAMALTQADGTLSEYRYVVQRIERRLRAGRATAEDVAELRRIAGMFREAKGAGEQL